MSDLYAFWRSQLAGENPETSPGTPHAGFFRGWGEGTYKRAKVPAPHIAIWQEDGGEWIARTDHYDGRVTFNRGWSVDEHVFPRCCRHAIPYEEYLAGVGDWQTGVSDESHDSD